MLHVTDPQANAQNSSYVLLAVSSTYFVNFYHSLLTATARKGAGVQYPNAYASDELAAKDPKAFKFNCGECHSCTQPGRHVGHAPSCGARDTYIDASCF